MVLLGFLLVLPMRDPPTGLQGMLRYNTEEHYFEYFSGQNNLWLPISEPEPTTPSF